MPCAPRPGHGRGRGRLAGDEKVIVVPVHTHPGELVSAIVEERP